MSELYVKKKEISDYLTSKFMSSYQVLDFEKELKLGRMT